MPDMPNRQRCGDASKELGTALSGIVLTMPVMRVGREDSWTASFSRTIEHVSNPRRPPPSTVWERCIYQPIA